MNYKLTISYKGTNYSGFAKQKDQITIEQTILDTFVNLFDLKVKLFASGRTDKYVHALNQVINVKHDKLNYDAKTLIKALNSKLPEDILVKNCEIVNDKFHARFNAKNKTYLYKINMCSQKNIFEQDIVYQYNQKIDFDKLEKYINLIKGEHNFLSFSTTELDNTTRTIYDFNYQVIDNILEIKISGNGFLRNMVRILVGVFLDWNENKIDESHIKKLLEHPKKGSGIRKANGCGLYLYEVAYL